MGIRLEKFAGADFLTVKTSGWLSKSDYERFLPAIDEALRSRGTSRVLVEMQDFLGWDATISAQSPELAGHYVDEVEKVALLVDGLWDQPMAEFCKPFAHAQVRYFDLESAERARRWVAA